MRTRRMRPGRRASLLLAPLLLASLLFACEAPLAPVLVEGAQPFAPPPVYTLWWQMTQECSGQRRTLARVSWYYVPGAQTVTANGREVEGYWSSAGNAIVLAEGSMMSGPLVRHEMLHALRSDVAHSRELFLNRCGGVVLCDGACLQEAGALPPLGAGTVWVQPDALEIGVEIRPPALSTEAYGGFFAMVVTARNPRSESVVVSLPSTTVGLPGRSFEYRIESGAGAATAGVRARDDGVRRFAPGEAKRYVFDFHALVAGGAGGGLPPGTYRFNGAYGGEWSGGGVTVTVP